MSESFLGHRLQVIATDGSEYKGVLYTIDVDTATISLKDVQCINKDGTEKEVDIHGFNSAHFMKNYFWVLDNEQTTLKIQSRK